MLSQAASAVQRARTDTEVFHTVGDQALQLGYQALILTLTDDGRNLSVAYCTLVPKLLSLEGEESLQPVNDLVLPFDPNGPIAELMASHQPIFFDRAAEPVARILAPDSQRLAEQITTSLGMLHDIRVPLIMGDRAIGVMDLAGPDLVDEDLPAVMAFANQMTISLENTHLYQEVQEHARLLERRVAERTLDLDHAAWLH